MDTDKRNEMKLSSVRVAASSLLQPGIVGGLIWQCNKMLIIYVTNAPLQFA